MLFAGAQVFWKVPNVYDVAGIAGFAVGLASIWLSWWLAKRDIRVRLAEATEQATRAARDEVRRVAQAVFHAGIGDTIRSVELARESCRGKRWPRAGELCELAREQLARTLAQPVAESSPTELREVAAVLFDCITRLRRQPRAGTGVIPDEVIRGLDDSILILHHVEGRITGIRLEADRGQ